MNHSKIDPSQVIRLKKLPVGGSPLTYQQLQATNSKTHKPTATIIAINHINDKYNTNSKSTLPPGGGQCNYSSHGHYVKNGYQYQNQSPIKNKSSINLYQTQHVSKNDHDRYNGSLGTPSFGTPSTSDSTSSPSPTCSSPSSRPSLVQTPPRSSSLIKSSSKSLSSLTNRSSNLIVSTNVSNSTKGLNLCENDGSESIKSSGILDEQEILQIELNFKALKSFVYVCRCLANLYFTKTDLINGGRISSPRSNEWELNRTGVPVLVFDSGETRSRPRRLVQLILAERGSGFPLWKDIIDNLTDYKSIASTFHTLYLSCDHRKMAGLSFDSNEAAAEFYHQVDLITSDPINIALTGPKGNRKGRLSKSQERERKHLLKKLQSSSNERGGSNKGKKSKIIIKSEISAPCLFQHVTSVDLSDFDTLFSISSLMLPPPPPPLPMAVSNDDTTTTTANDTNGQNGNQCINQRLSQLKVSSDNHCSPRSHSSSSPPPSVSSSVSTIDFDSSPVPSPSLQLPIPVPPPMPPISKAISSHGLIKRQTLTRKS